VKYILNWNVENGESFKDCGFFGKTEAFCIATEEQGRKTLHAHILVWLKNWNKLLHTLMTFTKDSKSYLNAVAKIRQLFELAVSTTMFDGADALQIQPFQHVCSPPNKRTRPNLNQNKYSDIKPVVDEQLAAMHHKCFYREHNGVILTCSKCQMKFKSEDVIRNSLNQLNLPIAIDRYPDASTEKILDYLCLLDYFDSSWCSSLMDSVLRERRLLLRNCRSNVHLSNHVRRCFKNGNLCFANLPDSCRPSTEFKFDEKPKIWRSFNGDGEDRYLFQILGKRGKGDNFVNAHNRYVTMLFGCNNNVLVAMSGAVVIYVTGYNTKNTQKEDSKVFETLCTVLIKYIQRQQADLESASGPDNEDDQRLIGFRRLLVAVLAHTTSNIVSAPMANFLALNESRFHYSHESKNLPLHALKAKLFEEDCDMIVMKSPKTKKPVMFSTADYYLERPNDFTHYSPYRFWKEVDVIK